MTFKYYKVRTPRSCNWVPNLGHCMYLFDLEPDLMRVPNGSKWIPLGFQILATVYVYSIWNPTSRGFQTVPNGFQILATVCISSIWNPTSKRSQLGPKSCRNVWHVQAGMRERIVIPVLTCQALWHTQCWGKTVKSTTSVLAGGHGPSKRCWAQCSVDGACSG